MKKLFLLFISILLIVSNTWGQVASSAYNAKVFDIEKTDSIDSKIKNAVGSIFSSTGKKVYYFNGFDFEKYNKNDPNLTDITTAEVLAIKNGITGGTRVTKPTNSYSIIGHSQGGLRALAYITEKQKNNASQLSNIDAVITVSGINQGLPLLDGGLAGFRRRAGDKVNIVGNGIRAAIGIFDVFEVLARLIPRNQLADGFGFFMSILPSQKKMYWTQAWTNTTPGVFRQLDDMAPNSAYINEFVARTMEHTYKRQTGTRLTSEWRSTPGLLGTKIWYLWIGYVPVYTTYIAREVIPVFNNTVPLGFIVGTNSKTLSMLDNEKSITDGIFAAEISFAVVQAFHIAKCVGIIGLFSGSVTYANDANRARLLMKDIDAELNDLKRSSENDGLVAVYSQFIPKTFKDPNTSITRTNLRNPVVGTNAGGSSYSIVPGPKLNHQNIVRSSATFDLSNQMINEGRNERKKQGFPR